MAFWKETILVLFCSNLINSLKVNAMLKILFAPLALLYGIAVYIRNYLFDIKLLKSSQFNIETICIGNLTVGGTGKTPHTEYLIELLKKEFKIATLSRGYKRRTNGFILADQTSNASSIGDEPYQMYCKFQDITVAVDEKRVRGINQIKQNIPDIEVILLDDAFQHRYVKPGCSILLVDYNNLITKDYFLPLGTLRDSITQTHRADIIIVTKCPASLKPIEQRIVTKELNPFPYQKSYFTTMVYGHLTPVFSKNKNIVQLSKEITSFALAGIANPIPFFDHLKAVTTLIQSVALSDHYHFTEKKINAIFEEFSVINAKNKVIVTTEKDASRLRSLEKLDDEIKKSFYFIPIKVKFLNDGELEFNKKIQSYVRKSKGNHSLHSK